MSPIIARLAARRAANMAGRRQFSVMQNLRSFARSFEAHPFERLPVANNSQRADWGRQAKRVASQGAMYVFPFGYLSRLQRLTLVLAALFPACSWFLGGLRWPRRGWTDTCKEGGVMMNGGCIYEGMGSIGVGIGTGVLGECFWIPTAALQGYMHT